MHVSIIIGLCTIAYSAIKKLNSNQYAGTPIGHAHKKNSGAIIKLCLYDEFAKHQRDYS